MRPRILAAIVAVALLAVVTLAVPLTIRLGHDARAQTIARLERGAVATTGRLPRTIGPGSHPSLPDLASDGDLAVYDTSGVRRGGEGPFHADAIVLRALNGHTDSGTSAAAFEVGVPVVRGLRVIAVIRASESNAVIDQQVRRQRLNIVLLAIGATVIAVLVGLAVSAALTRPLRRLRGAATRLGQGDFTVRAPRSGVSEVDDVAQALDNTAIQLGDLVERERTFSAHASHQLRTPLAALRLAVEAELARPRDDAKAALLEVLAEADRLEQTIGDLLSLARGSVERGPVDLAHVARAAEVRWRSAFTALGRPIRVRIEPGRTPDIEMSSTAIGQILDVLLGNALEHGAGVVTIAVRQGIDGGAVVAIEDEGPGISRDQNGVFSRPATGGHGFGLPLAAALARAEGALLRLANRGPGPVFELTLT